VSAKLFWWEKPAITLKPYPHIPETEILSFMPEELKPEWHAFIRGSQALALDDGDNGIYSASERQVFGMAKTGLTR